MSQEGFRLTNEKCDQLVSMLEEFKAAKPVQLWPRLLEVVQYLKKENAISGEDAYQARYIRDCLAFQKEKAVAMSEVSAFLEQKFFPPEPPKAAPTTPAAASTNS